MDEYDGKAQRNAGLDDRQYNRKLEKIITQMNPTELSELLNDDEVISVSNAEKVSETEQWTNFDGSVHVLDSPTNVPKGIFQPF